MLKMINPDSTFKRETAFLLLCWLVYLAQWGDPEIFKVVLWPVFIFAGGAFGLDQYSKNIQPYRGNQ